MATTSTSPSPSTSIVNTGRAPSKESPETMVALVKDWDPSFSYQATSYHVTVS